MLSALHNELPLNLITLSDHKSVILPTRDKAFHSPHPEHKRVIQAREAETLCMFQLNLVDSYVSMHGGWADDHPLEGFTWGFASGLPWAADPDFAESPRPDLHIKDRCRRIDRILIPYAYESHLAACYPTFLASSDHKALVMHLQNTSTQHKNKRRRCPTAFLQDRHTVEAFQADLDAISQDDETWWSLALDCIRTHAFRFERTLRQQGSTKLQAVMMHSTSTYVPAEAWEFLRQKGYHTTTPKVGYTILVSLANRDTSDRTTQLYLSKPKSTLDDPHADNPRRKQAKVWRLVKQLQNKRKPRSHRNRHGVLLPNRDDMAAEILQFWDSTMSSESCTAEVCSHYLRSFFRRFNIKLMSQMLARPLTLTLVEAALASLNQTSSPGIDGIPCAVYSKF